MEKRTSRHVYGDVFLVHDQCEWLETCGQLPCLGFCLAISCYQLDDFRFAVFFRSLQLQLTGL